MTYTPKQIDEIIERYGVDNSRNTTDDLANVAQQLRDDNRYLRRLLHSLLHAKRHGTGLQAWWDLEEKIKRALNQGGE